MLHDFRFWENSTSFFIQKGCFDSRLKTYLNLYPPAVNVFLWTFLVNKNSSTKVSVAVVDLLRNSMVELVNQEENSTTVANSNPVHYFVIFDLFLIGGYWSLYLLILRSLHGAFWLDGLFFHHIFFGWNTRCELNTESGFSFTLLNIAFHYYIQLNFLVYWPGNY